MAVVVMQRCAFALLGHVVLDTVLHEADGAWW